MDDMEIFRKLANCTDKEQMQRCIDEYNESQKPFTNADRIRAMSDEELADFITNCGCPDHARDCRKSCADCNLEWLKQPAEVE